MTSKKYFEACDNFVKAVDVANEVLLNYPHGRTKEDIDGDIEINNKRRDLALYAEKEFQTMQCLNSLVEAFFTYFQECVGPDVEEFWRRIKEANLPYERENKLEKIMKRGRIRNDIEYDYVVDTIVPFQQEGIISEDDVKKLNDMIEKFENKRRRL
ncbi:MAG: hypothetical protein MJZ33_07585 [Paludibacteraceae bacterium]|nr:hypothetical protein [Paludibacteraceae bacterium]